jgi:hypothetical protein
MSTSMLFRTAPILVGLSLLTSSPTAQVRPAPDVLARALQTRYQGIRDFSADFVQTYRGGVLRTRHPADGVITARQNALGSHQPGEICPHGQRASIAPGPAGSSPRSLDDQALRQPSFNGAAIFRGFHGHHGAPARHDCPS